MARLGVIGGSGFYELLQDLHEQEVSTPFGPPSDAVALGSIEGQEVAFIPRHGKGHRYLPGEIPFRANILALKQLGCEWIISASAVGSLQADIEPLQIVVPDQFIDRTQGRTSTFFGEGVVAHISFADPFCPTLSHTLVAAGKQAGAVMHEGGTYLCMEGPAFSTRAESQIYRSLGAHVIGMTNLQEAKLAREAELCYASLALVTDYDCWHDGHEAVTVNQILDNLHKNVVMAKEIVRLAALALPERSCSCKDALRHALFTRPQDIPAPARERLKDIIGRYVT